MDSTTTQQSLLNFIMIRFDTNWHWVPRDTYGYNLFPYLHNQYVPHCVPYITFITTQFSTLKVMVDNIIGTVKRSNTVRNIHLIPGRVPRGSPHFSWPHTCHHHELHDKSRPNSQVQPGNHHNIQCDKNNGPVSICDSPPTTLRGPNSDSKHRKTWAITNNRWESFQNTKFPE